MRISDWSSDVCSSDLLKVAVTSPAKENKRDVKQQGRHHDLLDASAKPGQAPYHGGHSRHAGPDKHNDCGKAEDACDHLTTSGLHARNIKTGVASYRERVVHY